MSTLITTRREFVQKGLTILAVGATVPSFLSQTAWAIDNPLDVRRTQGPTGKDGRILVVVQLAGGNDGLNMVIPYADDHYHRARPTLGHDAKTVLKVDDYIGLHPNLTALKDLYDKGALALVQGVGYPNPDRSHFRSTDIWESAQPDQDLVGSGWLGRYFDNTCAGSDPHPGIAIGDQLPLAMRGEKILPLSFERPDSYRYNGPDKDHYLALNRGPTTAPSLAAKKGPVRAADQLDFLHRTAMEAQLSSDEILRLTRNHTPSVPYPGGELANGLKTVAAMINGGLSTRVYYVSMGGFDTHVAERARHDALMTQLSGALGAFWGDLKSRGNEDRVLMMTFSEFGRRVEQNASGGTDHGAAAPMLVLNSGVRSGVIGRHPSLADLDQGDLKYQVDFRSVYSAILQDWMGAPAKLVLGEQFPSVPLVKA